MHLYKAALSRSLSKDSLGHEVTIPVIPQTYELSPPTALYKNISNVDEDVFNLPRYRRARPLEYNNPAKGVADKNQNGEDGLWYVVHIPSAEVPFHAKKDTSDEDEEEEVVTVTHKPVSVFVPFTQDRIAYRIRHHPAPIEIKTEDECTVWLKNQQNGSFEQVDAKLSRRLFHFWPPLFIGESVADHLREMEGFSTLPDYCGLLEFISYLD